METNATIELNDSGAMGCPELFLSVITALEHLSNCLLIVPAPRSDVWPVLERTLNALMKDEPVHEVDLEFLDSYREELYTKLSHPAAEVSHADNAHFAVTMAVGALVKCQREKEITDALKYLNAAQMNTHYLYETTQQPLRNILAEYVKLKGKK